ncbi:ras-domain-containing protein, partial [Lactarius psammicola]
VRKRSPLLRFSEKQWLPEDEALATIGVDFLGYVHEMGVKGRKVMMSIWDTVVPRTLPHYYGVALPQGVILLYDVSNRESFEALPQWLEELENYVPPEVVKIVVGNKLDKEFSQRVPTTEGASFAQRTGCLFVEASAKTAVGVTEAFSDVVTRITDTPVLWGEEKPKALGWGVSRATESMPGNIDLSQVWGRKRVLPGLHIAI